MSEQGRITTAILRRRQLEARTGLSRSTIYDRLNPRSPRYDPSFPRPVKLGSSASAIGFVEREVDIWIESQILKREVSMTKNDITTTMVIGQLIEPSSAVSRETQVERNKLIISGN